MRGRNKAGEAMRLSLIQEALDDDIQRIDAQFATEGIELEVCGHR